MSIAGSSSTADRRVRAAPTLRGGRRPRTCNNRPPVKGLILSGGAGTRLRPITHTSAKQLVPIANKPILFYGIEDMAAAGIKEIGIIVGGTRDEITEAVGDGSRWGVEVTYIPQDEPLGLAHCVLIAQDYLGDDDFVMYLGDNMLQQGLSNFTKRFEAEKARSSLPRLGEDSKSPSAQTARCSGWSRSPSIRPPTWRSSASTCSTARSTRPCAASSRRGAASWRSPTPSSG